MLDFADVLNVFTEGILDYITTQIRKKSNKKMLTIFFGIKCYNVDSE